MILNKWVIEGRASTIEGSANWEELVEELVSLLKWQVQTWSLAYPRMPFRSPFYAYFTTLLMSPCLAAYSR